MRFTNLNPKKWMWGGLSTRMAESSPSVRVSGYVLGSLMFQHFNSDCDVEGLILGESKAEERSNITDSQIDQIQFEHTINIQKHIPCLKLSSFYSGVGEVDGERIRHILSTNKEENVIGWYKQRRHTCQKMTFREQIVHQNLKKTLSNHELIFLLLTPSDVTSSGSTRRLEYAVFKSHGSQFHNIPVLVSNLGLLEQQDYWRISTACSSVSYNRAIKKHRSRFFSSDGTLPEVDEVNDMNDSLQVELKSACRDVEESERLVEKLLADVAVLRRRVRETRQGRKEDEAPLRPQPQENVLLCEAMKTLFPGSNLLQTQVLSLEGFPLPQFCCNTDHALDMASTLPLILTQKLPKPRRDKPGSAPLARRKRCLPGSALVSKRRKGAQEETGDASMPPSGSDTEEGLSPRQNGSVGSSDCPVF